LRNCLRIHAYEIRGSAKSTQTKAARFIPFLLTIRNAFLQLTIQVLIDSQKSRHINPSHSQ